MKKRVFTLFIMLSMLCGCSSLKNSSQDFFAMDTFMNISVWANSNTEADTILLMPCAPLDRGLQWRSDWEW